MQDLVISLMDWHYVKHGSVKYFLPEHQDASAPAGGGAPHPQRGMPTRQQMPYGIRITPEPAAVSDPWLTGDQPWERPCAWVTVIHEPPLYRCWYVNGLPQGENAHSEEDRLTNDQFGEAGGRYVLCYAESRDGWRWEKPELGLYSFRGSRANNITCPYGKETAVFRDANAPTEERYKAFHFGRLPGFPKEGAPPEGRTIYECSGLYAMTSPDGLHWKRHPEPLIRYFCDTENIVTWDPWLKKYVGYFRGHFFAGHRPEMGFDGRGIEFSYGGRAIARAETEDFLRWPTPQVIMTPGPQENPADDYYSNGFTWHPDDPTLRLMFATIYHRDRDDTEIRLALSRDGRVFNWLSPEPIIPQGGPGSPTWGGGYAGPNLLYLPDGRMALPVRAAGHPHNERVGGGGAFCWALWQPGRIAGIEAGGRGEFFTQPQTFNADSIEMNARTGCGGLIETALWEKGADGRSAPIPGFAFEECVPFRGDAPWTPCAWRGGELSSLRGRHLELHFRLTHAKVFAFRFHAAKRGA